MELLNKPCTKEEIDAYNEFASLPLEERRRRVYIRLAYTFPNSELGRDILIGKFQLPKPRKERRRNTKKKQEQPSLSLV